jgi:hypothetical protein
VFRSYALARDNGKTNGRSSDHHSKIEMLVFKSRLFSFDKDEKTYFVNKKKVQCNNLIYIMFFFNIPHSQNSMKIIKK